jgi:nitrogen fixation protein FixH
MTGEFTGRHMALVMGAGFGVVVTVNLVMAVLAGSTFGGVVVENSYVASEKFNSWLERAERSRQLGWRVDIARSDGGRLLITTGDVPAGAEVSAVARHPLGQETDRKLQFSGTGEGAFLSRESLPPGRWTLRLEVSAGSETWRGERDLR